MMFLFNVKSAMLIMITSNYDDDGCFDDECVNSILTIVQGEPHSRKVRHTDVWTFLTALTLNLVGSVCASLGTLHHYIFVAPSLVFITFSDPELEPNYHQNCHCCVLHRMPLIGISHCLWGSCGMAPRFALDCAVRP